jgi:hypothetical protein
VILVGEQGEEQVRIDPKVILLVIEREVVESCGEWALYYK